MSVTEHLDFLMVDRLNNWASEEEAVAADYRYTDLRRVRARGRAMELRLIAEGIAAAIREAPKGDSHEAA